MLLKSSILAIAIWQCAVFARAECRLTMPVYGNAGERVPVAEVSVAGKSGRMDIGEFVLSVRRDPFPVVVFRDDRRLNGTPLKVHLRLTSGETISRTVELECPSQRASIHVLRPLIAGRGEVERVSGRVRGCEIADDWWIRYEPIMPAASVGAPGEAQIEKDGTFFFNAGGGRFLITVIVGSTPVLSFAKTIYLGRPTDVGVIDVGSYCSGAKR